MAPQRRVQLIELPSERHLAAKAGGRIGLVLVRPEALAQSSAARTRWRISIAPGTGMRDYDLGQTAWQLELAKAIGRRPSEWELIWDEENQALLPRTAEPASMQPARALP